MTENLDTPNNPRELFSAGGAQLGLSLTELQLDQYCLYLSELLRWNKKINLTGLSRETEIIINLFIDSLTPLLFLCPDKEEAWIDIGTGAGFPGLVLKIAEPEIQMTLVEPNRKKASFLHHLIGLLRLEGSTVLNARIEALDPFEEKYDLLVSRALSPKVVLEKGTGLIHEGGQLLFFQSRPNANFWQSLVKDYPRIALQSIRPVTLPFRNVPRAIVFLGRHAEGAMTWKRGRS